MGIGKDLAMGVLVAGIGSGIVYYITSTPGNSTREKFEFRYEKDPQGCSVRAEREIREEGLVERVLLIDNNCDGKVDEIRFGKVTLGLSLPDFLKVSTSISPTKFHNTMYTTAKRLYEIPQNPKLVKETREWLKLQEFVNTELEKLYKPKQ